MKPGHLICGSALVTAALGGYLLIDGPQRPAGGATATVGRWVDGDTVEVVEGDQVVTVRLLGVDTPEDRSYGGSNECVAPALAGLAAARAAELAPVGEAVLLEADGTDRYGRTLARVLVDGRDVGAVLVDDGLARVWPDGACPNPTLDDLGDVALVSR